MQQLAHAVAFLHHTVGAVHADIKPENILLDSEISMNDKSHEDNERLLTVKLIDFGCAVPCSNHHSKKPTATTTAANSCHAESGGTTAYWPPERFENHAMATSPSDMWSLGILLFILLTHSHPLDPLGLATDEEIQDALVACRHDGNATKISIPRHLSAEARDVLERLLAVDPQQRLTATELLEHPWITQQQEPLESRNRTTTSTVASMKEILTSAAETTQTATTAT
uniref:Protein kinase domain-containing protein n=1 Tax=Entomoneis paludosa TaxID=265537 RepID=A0A7S2YU53_9STRA